MTHLHRRPGTDPGDRTKRAACGSGMAISDYTRATAWVNVAKMTRCPRRPASSGLSPVACLALEAVDVGRGAGDHQGLAVVEHAVGVGDLERLPGLVVGADGENAHPEAGATIQVA